MGEQQRLNPTALPVEVAARLLSKAGGQEVTEDMIREDIEAGFPANEDGTVNLIRYAAWLAKEAGRAD